MVVRPGTSSKLASITNSGPSEQSRQFRWGQIQIVFGLHHVIGKLVPLREANAIHRSIRPDHIHTRNLGFLAAVQGV